MPEAIRPSTTQVDPSVASLRRVTALTRQLAAFMNERELEISRAVAVGYAWAEIAASLGRSPQAAHKAYRWIRHSDKTGEVWYARPLLR